MKTIFFDESGYTGGDLINQDQKVFVLSSLWLTDEEATALKNRFFSRVNATELKFATLKKSPKHMDAVVDFFTYMANEEQARIKIGIAHKEFVCVAKIADFIVENFYYECGKNFFLNGHNIAFCNALFVLSQRLNATRELVELFSKYYKTRSDNDFDAFKDFLEKLSARDKLIKDFTDQILMALNCLGKKYFDDLPPNGLDVQGTIAIHLIGEWSGFFSERFNVLYDVSHSINENKGVLLELAGPNAPVGLHGRDRRTMELPLKINEMIEADSRDHVGIQLCDVLAGLVRMSAEEVVNSNAGQTLVFDRIFDPLNQLKCFTLWPSLDISPDDLGTRGKEYKDILNAVMAAQIRSS